MTLNFAVFVINGKEIFRLFSKSINLDLFSRTFASLYNNIVVYDTSFKVNGHITIHEDLSECFCTDEYALTLFKRLVSEVFEGDIFAAVTSLQGTSLLSWEENHENSG